MKHILVYFLTFFCLFSQEYKLKTFQMSLTSEVLNSQDLQLKGTINSNFITTSSGDSITLKGGLINGALGLYSDPPRLTTFFRYYRRL